MRISDEKYPRNFLIFNLCFVCDSDARTVQYELVVRKLAEHLVTLEVEQNFLSTESNRAKLPKILGQILSDLNRGGLCTVTGRYMKILIFCLTFPTFTIDLISWDLNTALKSDPSSCWATPGIWPPRSRVHVRIFSFKTRLLGPNNQTGKRKWFSYFIHFNNPFSCVRYCHTLMDAAMSLEWQSRPTWTLVWSKPAFKISCKPIDVVKCCPSLDLIFSFRLDITASSSSFPSSSTATCTPLHPNSENCPWIQIWVESASLLLPNLVEKNTKCLVIILSTFQVDCEFLLSFILQIDILLPSEMFSKCTGEFIL